MICMYYFHMYYVCIYIYIYYSDNNLSEEAPRLLREHALPCAAGALVQLPGEEDLIILLLLLIIIIIIRLLLLIIIMIIITIMIMIDHREENQHVRGRPALRLRILHILHYMLSMLYHRLYITDIRL